MKTLPAVVSMGMMHHVSQHGARISWAAMDLPMGLQVSGQTATLQPEIWGGMGVLALNPGIWDWINRDRMK